MALRMVRSLRATAMRATILGLPAARRRSRKALRTGFVTAGDEGCEEQGAAHALAAAADHALALPLAGLAGVGRKAGEAGDLLLVEGAELGQLGDEGSGDDRSDAGTEARRSSLSRQAGEPRTPASISASISASSFSRARTRRAMLFLMRRTVARRSRFRSATIISMIWRRRATRSARSCVASSGRGRTSGFMSWPKRAIMAASIGSVLARVPAAWAKWRIWAGLATTRGRAGAGRAAPPPGSKAPG